MNCFFPDSWFEYLADKSIIWVFGTLAASFWGLFKGSDWFVAGAAGIAKKIGIPIVIIGVTIVSLGTTSPEATVSIMAAFEGKSGFALGNAIGSIISNTALVFGLGCVLARVPVDKYVIRRQGVLKFFLCTGFITLCYALLGLNCRYIARPYGFVLLAILAWYILKSINWSNEHHESGIIDEDHADAKKPFSVLTIIFLTGLFVVVVSSKVLIGSATQICIKFGVPQEVIAATVVAFGTSVPELATGIASVIKGHREILLGNIIGANILNILIVIGGAVSLTGLKIAPIFYYLHFPFFIVIITLFTIFSFLSREYYKRIHGGILLFIYASYVILLYLKFEI